MGWRADLARTGATTGMRVARARARDGIRPNAPRVQRSFSIAPDWRTVDDDQAAVRLGPRETIDVARPVGRWRSVDPRLPTDGWARPWSAAGLVLWLGAVGASWWVGSTRGRGPLGSLHDDPPGR
jgi:hypothetical protein